MTNDEKNVIEQAICCIEGWINACGPSPDAGDLAASEALRTLLKKQGGDSGHLDDVEKFNTPVGWISVKDSLPQQRIGISYKRKVSDVVLVRHSDRPDYPITAHAVLGENLGAGIALPTNGAAEEPEIAWYSAAVDLNNPFGLKDKDYSRYLPKIFGIKITHWAYITTAQPRDSIIEECIAAYSPDDSAQDWMDKLRALKGKK